MLRDRHVVFSEPRLRRARSADLARMHLPLLRRRSAAGSPEDDRFFAWLFERSGLFAAHYRPATLRRRLPAVLRVLRVGSIEEARSLLERSPGLVPAAISAALIGVTSFFRDAPVFDLLRRRVLPEITATGRARIWSAGCSDGAELFSVAILLAELGRLERAELLGTDCRGDAVRTAERGSFDSLAVHELVPETLARHFDAEPPRWRVAAPLRAAARFRLANVLLAAETGPWDLILCRNVAIYLEDEPAEALWHRLAGALRPGGHLVVGKAERPVASRPLYPVGPCVYRVSA
jgi:chemotaxis protein methyltransferase CheR